MYTVWSNFKNRPIVVVNGRVFRHYDRTTLQYSKPGDMQLGECHLEIDGTEWGITDDPHLDVRERRSGRLLIRLENMRMIAHHYRDINPIPVEL